MKVPRFPGLFDDELHDIATAFDSLDVSFARAAANLVWPHFWPHFDDFWQIDSSTRPYFNALSCIYDVVARGGIEPPTFRFSGGRSYRLSYLAGRH